MDIPKIIWLLWFQGWSDSPEVTQASLISWQRMNPTWRVNRLSLDNISQYISETNLHLMKIGLIPPEAASDLIRLELLHLYGGVWADSTTICAKSLDDWLPTAMTSGFFAFDKPAPERLLSTWFLAAKIGSYVVERWRKAAFEYWEGRSEREEYFWVHRLFSDCYCADPHFKSLWDMTPKQSAAHAYHFGPYSQSLMEAPTSAYSDVDSPKEPVIKLTHKLRQFDDNSLMARLCRFGRWGSQQKT